jgi:hypothetical protein
MRSHHVKITRDTLSYTLGFLGSIYETVIAQGPVGERLPFLVIFVGIITAPAFLHKDDKAKETQAPPEHEEVG